MNETLIKIIMVHTDFLTNIRDLSLMICALADSGDVDGVNSALDNRERLLNLLDHIQLKGEAIIKDTKVDQDGIINAWVHDINVVSHQLAEYDEILTKKLEDIKENTLKEISTVYSLKEKFKGYNLNSVKK